MIAETGVAMVRVVFSCAYTLTSCDRVQRSDHVWEQNPKEDDMRKFLLLLLAVALVVMMASVSFAGDAQTVNGWVSDSKCGAKGANAGAEACTKKCIGAGASPVVVSDKDQTVLTVDNPDALREHYGHHVAVTGHIDGDKIHVESVKML